MNNNMLGKATVYKDVKNMICKGFLSLLIFFAFIFSIQSFLFYKYIKLSRAGKASLTANAENKTEKKNVLKSNNKQMTQNKKNVYLRAGSQPSKAWSRQNISKKNNTSNAKKCIKRIIKKKIQPKQKHIEHFNYRSFKNNNYSPRVDHCNHMEIIKPYY